MSNNENNDDRGQLRDVAGPGGGGYLGSVTAKPLQRSELWRLFEIYRDYLKHEDGLATSRLNRLLTVQAFLFAALGFVATTDGEKLNVILEPVVGGGSPSITLIMLVTIQLIGLVTGVYGSISIRAAFNAIGALRSEWNRCLVSYLNDWGDHSTHRDVWQAEFLPGIVAGGEGTRIEFSGASHYKALGWIITLFWVAMLICTAYNFLPQ